jgi:putative endonuclease
MYYVYVLKSKVNVKIYVGYTKDLKRRLKEHKSGKGVTTKTLKTTTLIFYEAFIDKKDAIRRENYFKTTKGKSSLRQIIRYSLI